jgi:hypothetical protein
MSPKFRVGDRVEHIRAKTVKGFVVEVTTRPDHPIGGWWYIIEMDPHRKRPVIREFFAERVLVILDRLADV